MSKIDDGGPMFPVMDELADAMIAERKREAPE